MKYIVLGLFLLALNGCISDQSRVDIGKNCQTIYNAAASLPASPQTTAIELNAAAIGTAVGYPLAIPTAAPTGK